MIPSDIEVGNVITTNFGPTTVIELNEVYCTVLLEHCGPIAGYQQPGTKDSWWYNYDGSFAGSEHLPKFPGHITFIQETANPLESKIAPPEIIKIL